MLFSKFNFPGSHRYFLIVLFLLGTILTNAQQLPGKVKGEVVDEHRLTIPYAQVSLKRSTDSTLVKTILADEKGAFVFEAAPGKYFVEVRMMGYHSGYSNFFTVVNTQDALIGVIPLRPDVTQLAGVQISASLPFVERRADKLIVNLNGMGSGAPIMEVMNQLPGVVVTPDDRISLNGKSVQVYIDGKASTLSADALAGLLKGISSSSIQKVELIAQPSARYDAAGGGGIINIIRKRNYKAGLNGNVYGGFGKGSFGKANGGINLNYKGVAYNVLLNMDYNYNKYFFNSFIASTFLNTDETVRSSSVSDIQSTRTNANYTPNLGIDFYLSKRTTLSASVKPGFQFFDRNGVADMVNYYQTNHITSGSRFINPVNIRATNFSSGIRLQHQIDTLGRDLTVDLDYYRYGNYNDQDNWIINLDASNNPVSALSSVVAQDRVFDVYALKVDYTHPLGNGRQLEIGMKNSYVNADNVNFYSDLNNKTTDSFIYKENIAALYLTYARNGEKFSYNLGIRGEYTFGEGAQQQNQGQFTRKYFQPFPSIHLDYKLTKNHNLSLGLNKRVERPGYENLNPLVRIISAGNLQQGNPELNPVVTYNTEVWYGYRNEFFLGLTYNYSLNDFTTIAVPLNNGVTTQPGNADYSGYVAIQAIYNKQICPWWFTGSNAILSKRSFKGEFNGLLLQSDGIAAFSASSYNSFTLTKNFSLMMLFNYRGKNMERTITNQANCYVTAGIRQQFLNKRASMQLNFVDIFKSYRNSYQQNSGSVQQIWHNQFETRMVKLNFNYNFGGTVKNTKKSNGADEERNRSTVSEN